MGRGCEGRAGAPRRDVEGARSAGAEWNRPEWYGRGETFLQILTLSPRPPSTTADNHAQPEDAQLRSVRYDCGYRRSCEARNPDGSKRQKPSRFRTTRIGADRMAILPPTTMSMLLQDWRGTGPPHSRRAIPARGCGSAGAFGSGRATPKSPKLLIAPQVADEISKWTMPLSSTTSIAPRHLSGHHICCSTSRSSIPLSLQRRWGRWCWRAFHRVRQESASNEHSGTQAILLARSSLQRVRVHKRG